MAFFQSRQNVISVEGRWAAAVLIESAREDKYPSRVGVACPNNETRGPKVERGHQRDLSLVLVCRETFSSSLSACCTRVNILTCSRTHQSEHLGAIVHYTRRVSSAGLNANPPDRRRRPLLCGDNLPTSGSFRASLVYSALASQAFLPIIRF